MSRSQQKRDRVWDMMEQYIQQSEKLRRRDEFGDDKIRKMGKLFIEIFCRIESEYIKYRQQFSLLKKFVRFMKFKFGQITNETSIKLKNLYLNVNATAASSDKD
eukprot:167438_1